MTAVTSDVRFRRIITLHSICTSIYTSFIIFILVYTHKIYEIGKRSSLPVIGVLIVGECLKVVFRPFTSETSTKEKQNKPKKFNLSSKLKCALVLCTSIVIYYCLAVLFGAPFLSSHEETFMFALLLTVLTVLPSCLAVGADVTIAILIDLTSFEGDIITETIKQNICVTLVGAWLGAVVIPLDWDRPWQAWPIPCSLGAVIAYMCSNLFNIVGMSSKTLKKKTGRYNL
ncbi:hypothetical protein PPYR_15140 [Photinus pyralis]|uniref:Phosphatidylinositol-glycan biosynthesis class F protein n=1 Tax=Photinus pyralis TaxID=7054 RepID=A0A1Y1MPY7_PHOPY|nr:phosphatidylinositol-glycan biosynthesis class F protein [Photinus pyralis]KAB0790451.1 hypothetical protein PPYR_15140 [Photinus pyralis]